MTYDEWKATNPADALTCSACGGSESECSCADDAEDRRFRDALTAAERDVERYRSERDKATEWLELVCSGDFCARETAIVRARKWLAGLKDIGF